jgi:hypothetical protein
MNAIELEATRDVVARHARARAIHDAVTCGLLRQYVVPEDGAVRARHARRRARRWVAHGVLTRPLGLLSVARSQQLASPSHTRRRASVDEAIA